MSALAGIYPFGRAVVPVLLARMIETMAHRAPDGSALWRSGSVGIAHGLLRTTLEDELQPLEVDEFVIVADVRLDNRMGIAAIVGLDLSSPTLVSDTRLILEAYRRWGEQCPKYLLGDFAFVLWDGRRRALFCARDHFGVKPLYYCMGPAGFGCATEIKALLTLPWVRRRLDESRLGDLLAANLEDDPAATLFQDIRRLPARHSLTVTAGELHIHEYWHPEPPSERRGGGEVEYAHGFHGLFEEAIRGRLRGIPPIGAMLSGGLDSSSIAVVARDVLRRERNDRLVTFSRVFDRTPARSERPFIEQVLAQGGFEPHFIVEDEHAPFGEIERILTHQDEAFRAPGLSGSYPLYEAASAHDVRILLDGHGGDEVVSHGYGRLHELALAGRWVKLWREARGFCAISPGESALERLFELIELYGLARHRARYKALDRLCRAPGKLRRWLHKSARGREASSSSSATLRSFISEDFIRRTELDERKQRALQAYADALRCERTRHFATVFSGMPSYSFEILDRAAASAHVEPRYPFYDKRLVEFCLALPAEQKLQDGWGRLVLRRAMTGLLPPEIQWRRDKLDFTPHLIAGMLTHHRALVTQVLDDDVGGIGRYMNLAALRQAYARLARDGPGTKGREAQAVWLAVVLALWLRQLDNLPSAMPSVSEAV